MGSRGAGIGALAATLLLASVAEAAGSFQGLGDLGGGRSTAAGVSADGSTVVGTTSRGAGDEAFRWTAAEGMVGLGVPAGGESGANAASTDGTVVVGRRRAGGRAEAFRWTAIGGMQGLGFLRPDDPEEGSEAFAASADGSVIVGVSGRPPGSCANLAVPPCSPAPDLAGTEEGFRWTAAGGMVGLGTLPLAPDSGSVARGVSADGGVIAGDVFGYTLFCFPQGGGGCTVFRFPQAFVRSPGGPMQALGHGSEARAVSPEGTHVVGVKDGAAAQWTAATGFTALGLDPGFSAARAASAGGTVIVGGGGAGAFLWRDQPAYLKTLLMTAHGLDLAGWALDAATGVSADGRTVVGGGSNPQGNPEGWIVRLDALPDPVALDALPPTFSTGLLAATLPTARSARVGVPSTVFATILNGATPAVGCRIAPATPVPVVLDYHRTDPSTNETVGSPNTPVDIPANGSQSFVIGFTPIAAFAPTEVRLSFDCANSATPAPRDVGLNTVLLSASDDPVPDVVALAATLAGDGVARLGLASGDGVFAVATVNLGASAEITATVDVGALPVEARICRTEPATGVCVGGPPSAPPLVVAMPAGATASFGIFLHTDVLVALDARRNRATVRFSDAQGVVRGATGVAVHTEIVPPAAAVTSGE